MLSPSPVPPNLRVAVMSPYTVSPPVSKPVSNECFTAGAVFLIMQKALQQFGRQLLSRTVADQSLAWFTGSLQQELVLVLR